MATALIYHPSNHEFPGRALTGTGNPKPLCMHQLGNNSGGMVICHRRSCLFVSENARVCDCVQVCPDGPLFKQNNGFESIRYGVVANIIASHAIARGSIPRVGSHARHRALGGRTCLMRPPSARRRAWFFLLLFLPLLRLRVYVSPLLFYVSRRCSPTTDRIGIWYIYTGDYLVEWQGRRKMASTTIQREIGSHLLCPGTCPKTKET